MKQQHNLEDKKNNKNECINKSYSEHNTCLSILNRLYLIYIFLQYQVNTSDIGCSEKRHNMDHLYLQE